MRVHPGIKERMECEDAGRVLNSLINKMISQMVCHQTLFPERHDVVLLLRHPFSSDALVKRDSTANPDPVPPPGRRLVTGAVTTRVRERWPREKDVREMHHAWDWHETGERGEGNVLRSA